MGTAQVSMRGSSGLKALPPITAGLNDMQFQASRPVLAGNEAKYVQEALASGWICGHGSFVTMFEQKVSSFLNLEEGIAVCSGTAALQLAMRSMGVGPGDDVIVPALSFVACANAVHYCGGNPVFADCDPITGNLTTENIEAVVTPQTRGVLVVHMFGLPNPVEAVRQYCRQKGLWLVEDCAHSFGALVHGRSAGSFGDAAIFSFYGNKIISTGEGGMFFASDPQKRHFARCLREQGLEPDRDHWHVLHGYNYRMHNLAAAIGCGQVEMADYHIAERIRVASRYRRNLRSLEESGIVRLPVEPAGTRRVYWLYSVVLCQGGRETRERVRDRALKEFGIQTRPFYVPMHKIPLYKRDIQLPNAEFLGDHGFLLPTYSGLADQEVDDISQALRICLAGKS
jgi:perosamine synthetase